MAPRDALVVGSALVDAGQLSRAVPYLVYAQQTAPTAFGWQRLAKLCREAGLDTHAADLYNRVLALEPDNRYALVGRAAALARTNVSVSELVAAALPLADVARAGDPVPALRTLASVFRTLSLHHPHPAILREARTLSALARRLDDGAAKSPPSELVERLEHVFALFERTSDASCAKPKVDPGQGQRALPAPSADGA